MTGVSTHMIAAVRESLAGNATEGMFPIEGMDHHFCSFEKDEEGTSKFKLLFPVDIDGKQVFIYFKM
jgi:hypothetical protein